MAQCEGYGAIVGGRAIRTELANARSTGFLTRLDGSPLASMDLMSAFHNMQIVGAWNPSASDKAIYNLGDGMFVDFEDHESFKQALRVTSDPLPRLSSRLPLISILNLFQLPANLNSSNIVSLVVGSLGHVSFRLAIRSQEPTCYWVQASATSGKKGHRSTCTCRFPRRDDCPENWVYS
jgi:hypothetical protein